MADILHFAPNVPVFLCLVDPEGDWDADMRQGTYRTTAGQTFTLPRPAVIKLNELEPRPGEEIQITRHWKGRKLDPVEWTISLSPASEKARAAQEIATIEALDPQDVVSLLEMSIEKAEAARPLKTTPTLIRKPAKKAPAPEPGLFDRGTGTDGPAPQPQPASVAPPARTRPAIIPWNVAFREVSAWVAKELAGNKLQWSDEAQQALCCTVLIAEVKAGRIGPWERGE